MQGSGSIRVTGVGFINWASSRPKHKGQPFTLGQKVIKPILMGLTNILRN